MRVKIFSNLFRFIILTFFISKRETGMKICKYVLMFVGMFISTVAFAQGDEATASSVLGVGQGLLGIGAGLAIGIGAFGAATGQGRATGSVLEGVSRNPSASKAVFANFMLGLAFMEFQALLGFVIAFMLYGKI